MHVCINVNVSILLSPQAKWSLNILIIREIYANNFPFKYISFWEKGIALRKK